MENVHGGKEPDRENEIIGEADAVSASSMNHIGDETEAVLSLAVLVAQAMFSGAQAAQARPAASVRCARCGRRPPAVHPKRPAGDLLDLHELARRLATKLVCGFS
jgi:hypothetical protein